METTFPNSQTLVSGDPAKIISIDHPKYRIESDLYSTNLKDAQAARGGGQL